MCIIADNVKSVDNTNIAVFHIGYNLTGSVNDIIPGQLVIYSATVDSLANQNAFILPVYNPSRKTDLIIPLDLSAQDDFFKVLNLIYDRWFPKRLTKSYSESWDSSNGFEAQSYLPVHKVGDYKFSIMPHKSDFNRIDQSQLYLNPTAKVSIDIHSDDYSFIVYQFYKRGKLEITPFGYICPSYQSTDTLFVPTIHGHPHEMFSPAVYSHMKEGFEQNASYDHVIYAVVKCTETDKKNIIPKKNDIVDLDHLLRKIKTDYLNRNIRMWLPKCFVPKKINIKNHEPNRNFIIDLSRSDFLYDLTCDIKKIQY